MQSPDQARTLVGILDLKKLARARLSSSSALRDLILSEPDYLPEEEVLIKVKMYSRLLYRELRHSIPDTGS
jgi:hypothetical protein